MAVTMSLGGVSLGENFPIFGRAHEVLRPDDQGPSIRKVIITLTGFLEGDNSEDVLALYDTLENLVGRNDTTFSYTDGSETVYTNKFVYIQSYNEPGDTEFAKYAIGDYNIELYYFEDNSDSIGIACTYGAYTFEKAPKWSREIFPNRSTYRSEDLGSSAVITLTGFLFADTHAALMAKIEALQLAFQSDAQLTYGVFSQTVKRGRVSIPPVVVKNYAFFDIELFYDLGEIVELKKVRRISRIHQNPVITEEPFCDRRVIELMNSSGQTITYSFSAAAQSISAARQEIQTEANLAIQPGGIELPGGDEEQDETDMRVSITVIKFYNQPIIPNLTV